MKISLKCNNNVSLCGVNPNCAIFSFSTDGSAFFDKYRFVVKNQDGQMVWEHTSASVCQSATCHCLQEDTKYIATAQLFCGGNCVGSQSLSFETTFFPKQSKWVGHTLDKNNVLSVTKKFTVNGRASQGKLFACGLGFFDIFVNGKKLDNYYYKPVYTDYDIRDVSKNADLYIGNKFSVAYHTYDVSRLLVDGENVIEMQVANGYYNNNDKPFEPFVSYDEKKCIFELRYQAEGQSFVVDNLNSQVCYTNKVARLLRGDVINFEMGNHHFGKAQVKAAPKGEWYQSIAPCDKIQGEFLPQKQWWVGNDLYVDFGYNHSGGIDCVLQGQKYQQVTVKFYEYLRDDGSPEWKTCAYIEPSADGGILDLIEQQHTYFLSGGKDKVTPQFNWQCFRYAVFFNAKELVIQDLKSLFIYEDISFDGEFTSSNDTFSEICDKTLLTFKDNIHCGAITDCPHREKRPYTGDGQIVANAVMYTMDGVPLYTKWLDDILASQIADGYVPNTAPYGGGGGGYAWGNAIAIVPQVLYRYTGNVEYVAKSYPYVVKWIEFLTNHSQNHIVTQRYKNWDLGDWLAPTTTEFNITYMRTLCYKKAVDIACEFAQALGLTTDVERWQQLSQNIATAVFEHFYDAQNNCMCRNLQGETAMALAFGVVPQSHVEKVKQAVYKHYSQDRHFDTGIVATPHVLEYLTVNGMHDVAFDMMTATDFPSYKTMLEGETTLVESWDKLRTPYHIDETDYLKPGGKPNSHCHPMFGSVMPWFYKHVAGLNLDELYQGKLLFTPKYFDRLTNATAQKQTVFGKAVASWSNVDALRITLRVPARLTLVAEFESVAPKLIANSKDTTIELLPTNGKYSFTLPSGEWTIFQK